MFNAKILSVYFWGLTSLCVCMSLQSCATAEDEQIIGIEKKESQMEHDHKKGIANDLIHSQSPYLLQHAYNPVHWKEWSPEAFAEAKKRNVPVIVSIGYSTCHWCHVMAHESFEDQATADIMNANYVCIKVDREQHPEVDEIYMDTVQAMTGHGGWPLNAIVDHTGRPFFAGTYYPTEQWQSILKQINNAWENDRDRVDAACAEIAQVIRDMGERRVQALPADIWTTFDNAVANSYDSENPSFGKGRPKFPSSQLLHSVFAQKLNNTDPLIIHAENILEAMQDAGLHERVGGGFHRYSVDEVWRVPHFEKMLYDNAQLMGVYAIAGFRLQRQDFIQTAINTGDYMLRDMRMYNEQKEFIGYASAEDADDPGGEGSFYAWSPKDLIKVLGKEKAGPLITAWNVAPGTAEIGRSGHAEPVTSHIPQPRAADLSALAVDGDVQALRVSWEAYLPQLRELRDSRPRPGRDDKALTDLNALALRGFALLARYSGEQRFHDATSELVEIIRNRFTTTGLERLPGEPAFITDYGHSLLGLTDAFELLGDPQIIDLAMNIANEAIEKLQAEDGGFYTTPAGRSDLIRRSREDYDNAYPSGIHSLALGYVRLWTITGEQRWKTAAEGIFAVQSEHVQRAPQASATLFQALSEYERGELSVLIVGSAADSKELLQAALKSYHPGMHIIRHERCSDRKWPSLLGREKLTATQALVCIETACLQPAQNSVELKQRLDSLLLKK